MVLRAGLDGVWREVVASRLRIFFRRVKVRYKVVPAKRPRRAAVERNM